MGVCCVVGNKFMCLLLRLDDDEIPGFGCGFDGTGIGTKVGLNSGFEKTGFDGKKTGIFG